MLFEEKESSHFSPETFNKVLLPLLFIPLAAFYRSRVICLKVLDITRTYDRSENAAKI